MDKGLALGRDYTVPTVWYANDKVERGTKWEDENIEDGAVVTAAVELTKEGRRKAVQAAERAILMELYNQCGCVASPLRCVTMLMSPRCPRDTLRNWAGIFVTTRSPAPFRTVSAT